MASFSPQTYQAQLEELFVRRRTTAKRTLDMVRTLLEAVVPTHRRESRIQIVGTNGKGSTAAFLSSILVASGLRVGLFTSPHLHHFEERFRINGEPAAPEALAPHLSYVLDTMETLSVFVPFFDVATAIAARYFACLDVDVTIWEAGMGGAKDATTAIEVDATCLTSVGLDHQMWLGETLEAIAADKAGAFRAGKPVFSAVSPVALTNQLRNAAENSHASAFYQLDDDFSMLSQDEGLRFAWHPQGTQKAPKADCMSGGPSFLVEGIALSLQGAFQHRNAALAAACAGWCLGSRKWDVADQRDTMPLVRAIKEGLASTSWPGRLTSFSCWGQTFWVDGAHNPHATSALAESVPTPFFHLIVGVANDKDVAALLRPLWKRCLSISFCGFALSRATSWNDFESAIQPLQQTHHIADVRPFASFEQAFESARIEPSRGPFLVMGSLFLVADALVVLQTEEKADS